MAYLRPIAQQQAQNPRTVRRTRVRCAACARMGSGSTSLAAWAAQGVPCSARQHLASPRLEAKPVSLSTAPACRHDPSVRVARWSRALEWKMVF